MGIGRIHARLGRGKRKVVDTRSEERNEEAVRQGFYTVVKELQDRLAAGYDFRSDSILRLANELVSALSFYDFIRVAEISIYLANLPQDRVREILEHYGKGKQDANSGPSVHEET